MFPSRYLSCDDCGASVERDERAGHECDRERRLDYEVFQVRDELRRFEAELAAYLALPRGRFEAWYAERERRLRAPSRQ